MLSGRRGQILILALTALTVAGFLWISHAVSSQTFLLPPALGPSSYLVALV
ncbi:MAG: hypothetical protein ACR2L2_01390 [Acidobacteriota bacterium]